MNLKQKNDTMNFEKEKEKEREWERLIIKRKLKCSGPGPAVVNLVTDIRFNVTTMFV